MSFSFDFFTLDDWKDELIDFHHRERGASLDQIFESCDAGVTATEPSQETPNVDVFSDLSDELLIPT